MGVSLLQRFISTGIPVWHRINCLYYATKLTIFHNVINDLPRSAKSDLVKTTKHTGCDQEE